MKKEEMIAPWVDERRCSVAGIVKWIHLNIYMSTPITTNLKKKRKTKIIKTTKKKVLLDSKVAWRGCSDLFFANNVGCSHVVIVGVGFFVSRNMHQL